MALLITTMYTLSVSFNVALGIHSADQTLTLIDISLVHDFVHGFFYDFIH
jgi:hypothetical protein